MAVTPKKLIGTYLKIKDRRSELAAKFKEEDSVLVEKQNKIKDALLEHCEEHDLTQCKADTGLAYRTVKTRYWTSDWSSMYEFIKEHNVLEFFDKRLNQGNVSQFLEENPDLVPKGLNVDSEYVITVRKQ